MTIIKSKQGNVYTDYVKMLANGYANSLICRSKAGLGKTHTTIELLKDLKIPYVYKSGFSTPLSLYITLHENRDKIIVLDDMEMLLNDIKVISILKSVLWEVDGRREVSYDTTSQAIGNTPSKFEYTGKIILLLNEINAKYDESFKALLSRCINYELVYTFDDVLVMCDKILEKKKLSKEERWRVKTIIERNVTKAHDFNFRLLERLIKFVQYDSKKAEHLFIESLDIDEDYKIVLELMNSDLTIINQVRKFDELTGGSRAKFYRIKKKLKEV